MGSRRYQRPWATQRGLDQVQEHVDLSAVPAGDVDFATRFAVTTSVPLVLDSVEVALVRYAGTDPLHVQLVNEGPRDNPFFPVQPNTDSPVAQWTTEAPGTSPGHPALFKLASQTGAVLQPGAHYWIVATLDHIQSNQVGWCSYVVSRPDTAVEQRVYGIPPSPDGVWTRGGATNGGGPAIRVTAHAQ